MKKSILSLFTLLFIASFLTSCNEKEQLEIAPEKLVDTPLMEQPYSISPNEDEVVYRNRTYSVQDAVIEELFKSDEMVTLISIPDEVYQNKSNEDVKIVTRLFDNLEQAQAYMDSDKSYRSGKYSFDLFFFDYSANCHFITI